MIIYKIIHEITLESTVYELMSTNSSSELSLDFKAI